VDAQVIPDYLFTRRLDNYEYHRIMLWWQIFIIASLLLVILTAVVVVAIARSERGSP